MTRNINTRQPDPSAVTAIAKALPCSDIAASLLVNRGILSVKQARHFLSATVADLPSPFSMKGIDTAVARIHSALINHETILVFGDYDADGITATALLVGFLTQAGATVRHHLPHRILEGYGLKPRHITEVAATHKASLLITVDCGITSHAAALACREAGIDLIITDHHQAPAEPPTALAVIDPAQAGCPSGLGDLAGVGVAFYLLIALRAFLREKGFWKTRPEPNLKACCDLVAIGAIADIVPLTGENRILVRTGLELLRTPSRPGIEALIAGAKIKKPALSAEDVAFRLAPRLNAPGRIDHAATALELLLAETKEVAVKIAGRLNRLNTKRQMIEEEISGEIQQIVNDRINTIKERRSLVLAHRQWHQGVIGIAASRAARRYSLPVALITISGDMGIGSARSIPGLHLYDALKGCARLFEDFGGHAQAAGFRIRMENLAAFETQFEYIVRQQTTPGDFVPAVEVDCELAMDRITNTLVREIEGLSPFGAGNPEPLFSARNVRASDTFMINGRHRKMTLAHPGTDRGIAAIWFNTPASHQESSFFRRILFRLRQDTWNGSGAPQIIIEDAFAE
ncbi:single-stranded-DNA-specific exonuclease RecJ [Desulfosudis oleivorans]|uniref:Single-stranded-DNA-specific exonuclease RecJ n=1 Tax=Desulfosudis oleivorans (strain DSM 6200 / JCM 39069 / Hxd3) TaxID=96561 RepID=A8ZTX7_DESOH|nr:single-stranded-DNA-specific exonuclease RecJ [Desulfosudis oleivorans]ABW67910.1 single-stranded-DNA-specific exonuclease RecJ [Desulfosudis oleivorans Hxd3]